MKLTCNRCSEEIEFDAAEMCWWCLEYMCYECWDEFGHCGHEGAERYNVIARSVEQPEKIERAIAKVTKAKKRQDIVEDLRKDERPFSPQPKTIFDENGRLKF